MQKGEKEKVIRMRFKKPLKKKRKQKKHLMEGPGEKVRKK